MKGISTGLAPSQVRIIRLLINTQNTILFIVRNFILLTLNENIKGIIANIARDISNPNTPPSLLGIERKIA
jgi:hypothetical protein